MDLTIASSLSSSSSSSAEFKHHRRKALHVKRIVSMPVVDDGEEMAIGAKKGRFSPSITTAPDVVEEKATPPPQPPDAATAASSAAAAAIAAVAADSATLALLMCLGNFQQPSSQFNTSICENSNLLQSLRPAIAHLLPSLLPPAPAPTTTAATTTGEADSLKCLSQMIESAEKIRPQQSEECGIFARPPPTAVELSPSSDLLSTSTKKVSAAKSFGKTFLYSIRGNQREEQGDHQTSAQIVTNSLPSINNSASCSSPSQSSSQHSPSSVDGGGSTTVVPVQRSVTDISEHQQQAFAIASRFRTGPLRLWMVAGDTLQLWQFLLQLLLDMPLYSSDGDESSSLQKAPICWTGQGWEFKIADSEVVARLWGMYKNCPRMNYAKLARGLRFYYGKCIVEKTPIAFVYRFFNDKVAAQAIDGSRLKQCYDFTRIKTPSRLTTNNNWLSVAGELDRRTTIGELLKRSSQIATLSNNSDEGDGDVPVDLTTSTDLRPTKLLQTLTLTLMIPETSMTAVCNGEKQHGENDNNNRTT